MSCVCAYLAVIFLWNILPGRGWMLVQNVGGNYVCLGLQDLPDLKSSNNYMDFARHPITQLSDYIEVNIRKDEMQQCVKSTGTHKAANDARTLIFPAYTISTNDKNDGTARNIVVNLHQIHLFMVSSKLTPLLTKGVSMIHRGPIYQCYPRTMQKISQNVRTNIHDISITHPFLIEKSLFIMNTIIILVIISFVSIFGLRFLEQSFVNHYRIKTTAAAPELNAFERVHRRTKYLHAIFDTMAVGVVSTDTTLRITFMNSAAGQTCGCRPEATTGRHIDDVVRLTNGSDILHIEVLLRDSYRKHAILEDCRLVAESGGSVEVQQWVSPLTLDGELRGCLLLLHEVGAARDLIRRLSHTASHDALTQLPNRAHFEQYLQYSVTSSIRRTAQHALVYLDLDGFKVVNDTSGHAAGDALLQQVSHLMQLQLRKSDFLARLAGDEFAIILFNCRIEHALLLVKHLLIKISEYSFCWEGTISCIGASAGITRIDAGNTNTKELLAQADSACYMAKQRGKGQVCLFQD